MCGGQRSTALSWQGEAPAEPDCSSGLRLGGSLALPIHLLVIALRSVRLKKRHLKRELLELHRHVHGLQCDVPRDGQ